MHGAWHECGGMYRWSDRGLEYIDVENLPFTMVIVRSIKMAVVERSVNSHDRPMELISVVNRDHSCSSFDGSGSVSHMPTPSSMNLWRKKSWRGFPGEMCVASKMET